MRLAPIALLALAACEAAQPSTRPRDCGDVRCEGAGVQLDPADCQCKCGPLVHNLVCASGQACVTDGAGTLGCVSVMCTEVACERGMSCDAASGRCACGSGPAAPTCESWQTCELGRCTPATRCDGVSCGESGTCDPVDGACRCGGGPACEGADVCAGERCEPADPCDGVPCPEGTSCNPSDALCHCGSDAGRVCDVGESCRDGACVSDVCAEVSCGPGMMCDPDPEPGWAGSAAAVGSGPTILAAMRTPPAT